MTFSSNVPEIQFVPTGLITPTDDAILTGVIADIDAAFGGGLNPALETPQGQLASSETAIIADKNAQFVQLVNNVDPLTASGQWQDAIGRFYFLDRIPAVATVVDCVVIGVVGTVIPSGTLARDTSDNRYLSLSTIVIDSSGSANVEFQNLVAGPIDCPANTLTIISNPIVGWDTINNPANGTLGRNVESRADFEYRRKNSVALNGRGSVQAVYANVFQVANVLDLYVIDNVEPTIVNTGSTNYPMGKNSLYAAVIGGIDQDIADAIWLAKDMGCNYNGNTSVNVTDTSGYNYPYPTYAVKFQRPAALPILFAVSIVNNPNLPSDIITQIKNAIIARFNGTNDTSRERIGSAIFASNYYAPVAVISSSLSILSILIGTSTPTLTQVLVGIDQYPTITAANIAVTLV